MDYKEKVEWLGRYQASVSCQHMLEEEMCIRDSIHWLRLMPYKLNKDRKRAAMFYAGLVMVANDVADFSEHKKETLC